MNRPSKARVRASFERAAATYDSAAEIQRQVCDLLAEGLPAGLAPHCVLDAGCGTGYAQAILRGRFPQARSLALDFSAAMLQQTGDSCLRLCGDLEHLPLTGSSVDLYWSSLAVQWCDLPRALAEARRVLSADGLLALATLGPDTFGELRTAFASVDPHRHTLSFHDQEEISALAQTAGLTTVNRKNSLKTKYYGDFKSLLHAVKAIGANQLGEGRRTSLMSRDAFRQAEAAYENLRTPAGLPLSYDVITLFARP